MPHLQEKDVTEEKSRSGSKLARSLSSSSDVPITEAKEGFLQATEGLLTIKGMTSAHQTSSLFGHPRAVSEDASCTPRAGATKQKSIITPSPFAGAHHPNMYGPVVTIFGNKKLVPSPIRMKKRDSQAEEDCEEGSQAMSQPTNLRYANNFSTPIKKLDNGDAANVAATEPIKKRLVGKMDKCIESPGKKARVEESLCDDTISSQDEDPNETLGSRKPVISPTNSEEGPPSLHQSGYFPPYGGYPMRHHPNYHHPYPEAYPMYHGYPPHPGSAHFIGGPGAPPMAHYRPFPPPHPSHHHPMMIHPHPTALHGYSPHRRGPMPDHHSPDMVRSSARQMDEHNSVTDWHSGSISSAGQAPSAKRCLPLKEPIPSKYWGNAEKTKEVALPDFHRLVNYPDYLMKSRASDSGPGHDGKKNCVMCGKLRPCSASNWAGRGRNASSNKMVLSSSSSTTTTGTSLDGDGSGHIIPRQNKGLCTACDVTVWVAVGSDGMEIKWCKGCKNFRPWAAFGDKGSATKCERCRDRQREKYAAQKDELRQQHRISPTAGSTEKRNEKTQPTSEATDFGLQTLINAATG